MSSVENQAVILESDKTTDSVIILMHGLGADGNDFVPIAPMLELPATRFIFPNAPVIPVTINGGVPMRAWFDMTSIELEENSGRRKTGGNQEQILASVAMAHELANAQVKSGVPAEHIIFAGFSQGGVIALLAGLTWDQPSAGVLALSTYFPDELMPKAWPQQPAIYMAHGERDDVIPVESGRYSYQLLKDSGVDIEFHTYPMGHEVILDEIEAFKAWLQDRLLTKIN